MCWLKTKLLTTKLRPNNICYLKKTICKVLPYNCLIPYLYTEKFFVF